MDKVFLRGINPVLPTVYDDSLTYIEAIAKLQECINSLVENLNELNLEETKAEVNRIKDYVISLSTEIDTRVNDKLNQQNKFVAQSIQSNNALVDSRVDNKLEDFKEYITKNSNVFVIDPTTGVRVSVQSALDNVFTLLRVNSITANAYDGYEFTASVYDGKEITAYNFDINGQLFNQ